MEVHHGHINDNGDADTYMFTVSDLERDTHIVMDMWDAMDNYFEGYNVVA